jgi:hypothetical protein
MEDGHFSKAGILFLLERCSRRSQSQHEERQGVMYVCSHKVDE